MSYTGSVTGKVRDRCTDQAIAGATVSVGANGTAFTAITDGGGGFSFANLPISASGVWDSSKNSPIHVTGRYVFTLSLVDLNRSGASGAPIYKDYYYIDTVVTFVATSNNLVSSINFLVSKLNTTIIGGVVDTTLRPVDGARVFLYDSDGKKVIAETTSVQGIYRFSNVENGVAVQIKAVSADGQRAGSLSHQLTCNMTYDSLRNQVASERIVLRAVDNVNPIVIATNPLNNEDVSPTNLQITFTFSEQIKQTPFTRTNLGLGYGTIMDDITMTFNGMKKTTGGSLPFTAQWDPTYTQLILTPQGIVGSAKYSVSILKTLDSLTDLAGNPVTLGGFDSLNFTTNGSAPIPGPPNVLRRLLPNTSFTPLDFNGGMIGLEWNYDASARSYNIYKRIGSGSFQLLQTDIDSLRFSDMSGSLVNPPSAVNPLGAISVSYEVRAVSKDLVEGPVSNIITVSDQVKPSVSWGAISIDGTSHDAIANNVYYITIPLTEPLNLASVESTFTTKYIFANSFTPITTTKADYLGSSGSNSWGILLTVSPLGALVEAPTLTIQPLVTDLNGNALQSSNNANVYQFPFPTPAIDSLFVDSVLVASPGFTTLTVHGSNFTTRSIMNWNGAPRQTTAVSTTQLTGQVMAGDINTASIVNITVSNPSPAGVSSALPLTIYNPVPSVTVLSPSSVAAGASSFTLTVGGSNLAQNSVVRWNGTNLQTTFLSSTSLQATVNSTLIATTTVAKVSVFNPSPGGGISDTLFFSVNESFEVPWTNSGATPSGWSRSYVSGSVDWGQKVAPLIGQAPPKDSLAEDGQAVAWFNSSAAAGSSTRLESPPFDLTGSKNPHVKFNYVNLDGTDQLVVRFSTDGGSTWTTVVTLSTTSSNMWTPQDVTVPGAAGMHNVKIALEAVADGGASDIWVDNVMIVP
jgi:hypothetical protein